MSAPNTADASRTEDRDDFVGWVFTTATPSALICQTQSRVVTSGDYVNCCNRDIQTCHIATECRDNTLIYDEGDDLICDAACVTLTILPTNDATTSVEHSSRMYCAGGASANTVYRRLRDSDYPETISTDIEEVEPTRGGNDDSDNDNSDDGEGSSNAWIAGAVLGPLLLIALIVIGVILFRQRSQRKREPENNAPQSLTSPPHGGQFHNGYHLNTDSCKMGPSTPQGWKAELETAQRSDIGTSGGTGFEARTDVPYELPGEAGFSRQ